MPISPSIPTSFVPKQPLGGGRRHTGSSGNNVFLIIAIIIFALSALGAAGVYGYQKLLEAQITQKGDELDKELASIDQTQIQSYVRLHQRIDTARSVLEHHIMMSQLLDALEAATLPNIRFNSLSVIVAEDRSAKVVMAGSAKTFNALAVESSVFASKSYFKRAIFSGIGVSPKDGTIGFTLTADIDPKLLTWNATPAASTTPASSAAVAPVAVPVVAPATSTPQASVVVPAGSSTQTKP